MNTTLEFAAAALDTLRTVPDEKFNLNICGSTKICGCVVHWMYMMDVLKTRSCFGWNVSVARKRIMRLQGDTHKLRIILGFEQVAARDLYEQYDLRNVTKAQVIQQLEAYIDANS